MRFCMYECKTVETLVVSKTLVRVEPDFNTKRSQLNVDKEGH